MSIAPPRTNLTYPAPGESSDFEVSYEDFLTMPVTNQHVEVVDGVIHVMSGPNATHQIVQGNIYTELRSLVKQSNLGLVLMAPYDIIIRKKPRLRVRQPDVLFFGNARAGFQTAKDPDRVYRESQDGTLIPDLVIEVLSPGQNEKTLADKLADYASILVDEVWFADQSTKTIRVLALDGSDYRLIEEYGTGDQLVSITLPGLHLAVGAVFEH